MSVSQGQCFPHARLSTVGVLRSVPPKPCRFLALTSSSTLETYSARALAGGCSKSYHRHVWEDDTFLGAERCCGRSINARDAILQQTPAPYYFWPPRAGCQNDAPSKTCRSSWLVPAVATSLGRRAVLAPCAGGGGGVGGYLLLRLTQRTFIKAHAPSGAPCLVLLCPVLSCLAIVLCSLCPLSFVLCQLSFVLGLARVIVPCPLFLVPCP